MDINAKNLAVCVSALGMIGIVEKYPQQMVVSYPGRAWVDETRYLGIYTVFHKNDPLLNSP